MEGKRGRGRPSQKLLDDERGIQQT